VNDAARGAEMDMVDLVLTVCLTANPGNCRDEHLYFERRGSLLQCMSTAPSEIAKWSLEHPALKVVRWTCAYPGKEQTI
jgi:hypothetical protein